jgi:hypothetical protein
LDNVIKGFALGAELFLGFGLQPEHVSVKSKFLVVETPLNGYHQW